MILADPSENLPRPSQNQAAELLSLQCGEPDYSRQCLSRNVAPDMHWSPGADRNNLFTHLFTHYFMYSIIHFPRFIEHVICGRNRFYAKAAKVNLILFEAKDIIIVPKAAAILNMVFE